MEEEKNTEQNLEQQPVETEKQESNASEESTSAQPEENNEPVILKPTQNTEEIIDRQKRNTNKQLSMRVERYNYKNGFKNPPPVANVQKIEMVNQTAQDEYRLQIKAPRDNKKLIIIIIAALFICVGGFFVIKTLTAPTPEPKQKAPEETKENNENKNESVEPVETEIICTKIMDYSTFGYNYILQKKLYAIDEKLQKYENITKSDYLNEVSESAIKSCGEVNNYYKEYEGYEYTCNQIAKTITYSTKVDLNVLSEKELTFETNLGSINRTITENKDDDVNNYINEYIEQGYACETKK